MIAAPCLRALLEAHVAATPARVLFPEGAVQVLREWVTPVIAAPRGTWTEGVLSRLASTLALVWLAGLALGLVRLLRALARSRRLLASVTPAPRFAQERLAELARRRGIAPPRLCLASDSSAPFTAGVREPVIVLAASHVSREGAALDFVLLHELEHVARHDTRTTFLLKVALLAFVGHPLAKRLAAELAFAREARVDEAAGAASPLEYASFLVVSAERASAAAHGLHAVPMNDTALSRRIQMLVSPPSASASLRPHVLVAVAGSALLGAVFCAPAAWSDERDATALDVDSSRGHLPADAIQGVVEDHHAGFRRCYESLPRPLPRTGIEMHFVIGSDGSVSSGHIDSQPHVELGECAKPIMLGMRFPAPEGGSVSVAYPLEFAPSAAEAAAGEAAPSTPNDKPPALPADVIRRVVRENYPGIRQCYEQLPDPRPTLTLKMHFTLGSAGRVVDGHVDAEADPQLGRCVDGVMRGMLFPAPQGDSISVGYPIAFAPG
jgi:beta-lactamase regulating signal transducer with metallopeptidase domain